MYGQYGARELRQGYNFQPRLATLLHSMMLWVSGVGIGCLFA